MADIDDHAELLAAIDAWLDRVPLRRVVVEWVRARHTGVYLVGGSLRDALLGRDSYDLDFAVEGQAADLARQVANQIRGAYVLLDAERDVARVLRRSRGRTQQFDFARLRADSIAADLAARDSTVNALGLHLAPRWGPVLDPTGGLHDLRDGVLRAASPSAFFDDPVRVLRLVRLAGLLGFAVAPETESLAHEAVPMLGRASMERRRDEWLQILNLEQCAPSVGLALERFGLAESLLPGRVAGFDLERGLDVLARLEDLEAQWAPGYAGERAVPWDALGPLLAGRWRESLTAGRPRRALVRLAALLVPRPGTPGAEPPVLQEAGERVAEAARALRLSGREVGLLRRAVRGARLVVAEDTPQPLAIYRYYRASGEDGIEGLVLAMASADPEARAQVVPCALAYLKAWFYEHDSLVGPPRLISGSDVTRILGVADGPRVGALLESVREAQAAGEVHTREEALERLRRER